MKIDDVTFVYVDDDEIDRRAFKRVLKQKGMHNEILEAVNGLEALKLLEDRKGCSQVTVVLLDINMPIMDGHEFLDKIRSHGELSDTIVFVFTTSNDDQDRSRAYQKNVSGYLLKESSQSSLGEGVDLLCRFVESVEFPPHSI